MNKVEYIIDGVSLDLFDDEQIVLKRILKDFTDPEQVIGDFTRSFKIPATGKNNSVFKHWYNPDIYGGFNPNVAVDALIVLNGTEELIGVNELMDVQVEGGRPAFYTVTFYGNQKSLSANFGQDTLIDVPMTALDHELTKANIEASWDLTLLSGDVLYPVMAFERPFQYAANPSNGNVADAINTNAGAVGVEELRPAYLLRDYVQRIFSNYGLTVSGRFFTNAMTAGLYVLPMREAGYYKNLEDRNKALTVREVPNQIFNYAVTGSQIIDIGTAIYDPTTDWNSTTNVWTAPFTGDWTIQFDFTGNGIVSVVDILFFLEDTTTSTTTNIGIQTVNTFSDFTAIMKFRAIKGHAYRFRTRFHSITAGSYTGDGTVRFIDFEGGLGGQVVTHSLVAPNMKVSDFIAKMMGSLNLVIEQTGPKEWNLDFFEDWLNDGNTRNWDQYVDRTTIQSEKAPVFKSISMTHKEGEDVQNTTFTALTGRQFGSMEYRPDLDFATEELKVESPFTIIPSARMRKAEDDTLTDLELPMMIDESGEKVKADFVLFYYAGKQSVVNAWKLRDEADSVTSKSVFPFVRYNSTRPATVNDYALSYSLEQAPNGLSPIKTLFQEKWQTFIERFYNSSTRVVTFDAVLDPGSWIRLKPNDTIQFDDRYYKVETIDFNYTTGKARVSAITFEPVSIGTVLTIDDDGKIGFDISVGSAEILRLNAQSISGNAFVPKTFPRLSTQMQYASQRKYLDLAIATRGAALYIVNGATISIPTGTPTLITEWDQQEESGFALADTLNGQLIAAYDGDYNVNFRIKYEPGDALDLFFYLYKNGQLEGILSRTRLDASGGSFSGRVTASVGDTFEVFKNIDSTPTNITVESAQFSIDYVNKPFTVL